ncbi:MAG TPA: hypothetical protein VMU14_22035 [Acidimicrobiales bacterium]|nr:hypothetical protein [Acidimicrobiales bacterium]
MAHLSDVDRRDADQLEHGWGVKVAVQMLHEGQVSPMQFLTLCAEAASTEDARDEHHVQAVQPRRGFRGRQPAGRRSRVALSAV